MIHSAIHSTVKIHPKAVVDEGAQIGAETRIWHFTHVMPGAVIGSGCNIGQNVFIGNNVKVGNFCKIQNNVSLYDGVELEDYVFCGPSMVFTNVRNPRCEFPQDRTEFYLKTKVGRGASFGANCTVVCGVNVGKHAFIAAGAVITKDVPDFAMMVGVPARRIAWVDRKGEKLQFNAEGTAIGQDGDRYQLVDGRVVQM